ncbi:p53 and DNA damage-regulated protein 1-like isoform X2 [Uloborus diversus]|nr:p53 and DNA damage-regulated protein 1-like isoform X2 [Uloborus diversus]
MENSLEYIDYVSQLEEAGQDILIDKERIIDYSRRNNALREGKRALQSELKKDRPTSKTWLCFGNMFIKCHTTKALTIVEKDEKMIEDEINSLRDNLKVKVDNLRKLEGKSEHKFNLTPLSKEEMKAMRHLLPTVT